MLKKVSHSTNFFYSHLIIKLMYKSETHIQLSLYTYFFLYFLKSALKSNETYSWAEGYIFMLYHIVTLSPVTYATSFFYSF